MTERRGVSTHEALDRGLGEWPDTGCSLCPSCLNCELPRCRYDGNGGASALRGAGARSAAVGGGGHELHRGGGGGWCEAPSGVPTRRGATGGELMANEQRCPGCGARLTVIWELGGPDDPLCDGCTEACRQIAGPNGWLSPDRDGWNRRYEAAVARLVGAS